MNSSSASTTELKAWKAFVSKYREDRCPRSRDNADTTSLLLLISATAIQYIGTLSSLASAQSLYQKCASSLVSFPQFPLPPLGAEHAAELEQLVAVMQKQFPSLIDDPLIFGYTYQYWCASDRKTAQANFQSANKSIDSNALSAFTQIYTPLWVVDYILANTMLAETGNSANWLLPPARSIRGKKSASTITILDPACGAGNFLIRAFDELFELQVQSGVSPDKVAANILERQLAGTDIDPLALAIFTYAIVARCEKNGVKNVPALAKVALALANAADNPNPLKVSSRASSAKRSSQNTEQNSTHPTRSTTPNSAQSSTQSGSTLGSLGRNWNAPHPLADQYDVVVTNPPYIGRKLISRELKDLLKKNFPDANQDLSTAFLRRSLEFLAPGGRLGLITQASMMFLPSHGKLRKYILDEFELVSVVDAGPGVFPLQGGEKVNSGIFVIEKPFGKEPESPALESRALSDISPHSASIFIDLRNASDKETALLSQIKSMNSTLALSNLNADACTIYGGITSRLGCASADGSSSALIPPAVFYRFHKCAFNYHIPACVSRILEEAPVLDEIADFRQGLATSDNNRFVKMLWEVTPEQRASRQWVPYVKGAGGERWYSPVRHAVNWESDGRLIKDAVRRRYPYLKGNIAWVVKNEQFYFRQGLCFSFVNTRGMAVRLLPPGCIFDVGASAVFSRTDCADDAFMMGYLNSSFIVALAASLNPTINYQVGDLKRLPHIRFEVHVKERISELARQCVVYKRKLAQWTDPSSWFDWTSTGDWGAGLGSAAGPDPIAGLDPVDSLGTIAGLDRTTAKRLPEALSVQFSDFEKNVGEVLDCLSKVETAINTLVLDSLTKNYELNSSEIDEITRWTREFASSERQNAKLKLDNVFVDVVLSKRALVPQKNGFLKTQHPEDSQWLSEKLKRDSCEYFEKSFPERLTKLFYGRLPVSIT